MIMTLKTTRAAARIDSLGAQLISLKDNTGTEYIWQRDPAFWQNCSPLLFPIVGNCRDGKTIFNGRQYTLPKHGFCKTSDFTARQLSESAAVFTLRDSEDTLRQYPWHFELSLTYHLSDEGLKLEYCVKNDDESAMDYHIGAHPGFRCPLDPEECFEDYVLEFEQEETVASMVYDIPALQFDPGRRKPLLDHSRILPLTYELFSEDAIFFDKLCSRRVSLKNPATGRGVAVAFPDFETVAFWTSMPSKGPFLCVEPWNGSAIRADEDDVFHNRHFLQTLMAGESRSYGMEILFLPAMQEMQGRKCILLP